MNLSPINQELVDQKIKELRIQDIGNASIRELVAVVNLVEEASGIKYNQDGNGGARACLLHKLVSRLRLKPLKKGWHQSIQ